MTAVVGREQGGDPGRDHPREPGGVSIVRPTVVPPPGGRVVSTATDGAPMAPEVRRLIDRGLDLVPGIVAAMTTHFPRHVERAELVRAGSLGVVEAAWRFDPSRGVPFERFVTRRVRGAVLDALRADDWAPRSVRAAARRIELVEGALTARFGRRPTADEIGLEIGLDAVRVEGIRAAAVRAAVVRIDLAPADGGDDGVVDHAQPEPTAALERAELLAYLVDAVASLPERQRRVILGLFGEGRTTLELASELGVSRSRVSQLRSEALESLRRRITGRYRFVDRPATARR